MSYTLLWKVSLVISTIGTTTAPSLHLQIVWESLPKGCVSPRTGIGRNHVYLLRIYHSAWHKIGPAEFAMTALELIPIFIYWIALVLWITSEPPAPFKGIPQSLSFWSLTLEDFCDFLPVFLLVFFFFLWTLLILLLFVVILQFLLQPRAFLFISWCTRVL